MTDTRVAAAINVHGGRPEPRVTGLVDLLSGVHDVVDVLRDPHAAGALPVDLLMLNGDDLDSETALEEFLAALRADGLLDPLPRSRRPTADVDLRARRIDLEESVYVELTGDPTLLVALWLLTSVDGEYTVTEEYSVVGDGGTDVHKRVSFITGASLPELTEALRSRVE